MSELPTPRIATTGSLHRFSYRKLAAAMLLAALLPRSIFPANGGEWPGGPAPLIVPSGAGGLMDRVGRYLGERMSKPFGQSFVIDNRLGAGGTIGTQYVARAAADGYTLLVASV